jgi:hypothetical protein
VSFFDRPVPLSRAIGAVVFCSVLAALAWHGLDSRSEDMRRYGQPLTAKVIKSAKPRTVDSILGLFGNTVTTASIEVTTKSQPWDYDGIVLDGRVRVGQKLRAWFYDGNPNSAQFSGQYFNDGKQEVPWPSVGGQLIRAVFMAGIALLIWVFALVIFERALRTQAQYPYIRKPQQK